jgi:hypothetical protein
MKNILKNIFVVFKTITIIFITIFIGLIIFLILLVILAIILSPILPKSDYCLEDGDCKAGRIIIINNKEILINKNSCIENNWDWHEKSQYCKIKNIKFHPKEIIYE